MLPHDTFLLQHPYQFQPTLSNKVTVSHIYEFRIYAKCRIFFSHALNHSIDILFVYVGISFTYPGITYQNAHLSKNAISFSC